MMRRTRGGVGGPSRRYSPAHRDLVGAAALHGVVVRPQEREHADGEQRQRGDRRDPLPERGEERRAGQRAAGDGERATVAGEVAADEARRRRPGSAAGRALVVARRLGSARRPSTVSRLVAPRHHPQRSAEPLGQHVVGELGDGPLAATPRPSSARRAGRRAAPRTPPRPRAGRRAGARRGRSRRRRRPRPPRPSRRRPAARRTPPPRRTRCRSPPARARPTACGTTIVNTSAQPYSVGQLVVGAPARGTAPGPGARRPGDAAAARRARRRRSPARRSGRLGASSAAASIATSKPLRGTSREIDTTSSASSGSPNRRLAVGALVGASSGWKRSTSTPGGTTVTGSGRPAARSASPAAYSPAEMTWRARRSTLPSACLVPGSRPGTVTSAPCSTTSYGSSQRRADEPERHRRVEHDEVGADLAGQAVDAPHHPRVRQQHRLAGPLDAVRLGAVELRPRRRTGW